MIGGICCKQKKGSQLLCLYVYALYAWVWVCVWERDVSSSNLLCLFECASAPPSLPHAAPSPPSLTSIPISEAAVEAALFWQMLTLSKCISEDVMALVTRPPFPLPLSFLFLPISLSSKLQIVHSFKLQSHLPNVLLPYFVIPSPQTSLDNIPSLSNLIKHILRHCVGALSHSQCLQPSMWVNLVASQDSLFLPTVRLGTRVLTLEGEESMKRKSATVLP